MYVTRQRSLILMLVNGKESPRLSVPSEEPGPPSLWDQHQAEFTYRSECCSSTHLVILGKSQVLGNILYRNGLIFKQ